MNQSLLDIHKVASDLGDAHLCDFLESQYLSEQVDAIKEIGDLVTKIKMMICRGGICAHRSFFKNISEISFLKMKFEFG